MLLTVWDVCELWCSRGHTAWLQRLMLMLLSAAQGAEPSLLWRPLSCLLNNAHRSFRVLTCSDYTKWQALELGTANCSADQSWLTWPGHQHIGMFSRTTPTSVLVFISQVSFCHRNNNTIQRGNHLLISQKLLKGDHALRVQRAEKLVVPAREVDRRAQMLQRSPCCSSGCAELRALSPQGWSPRQKANVAPSVSFVFVKPPALFRNTDI